ncbi:MAG: glycosyltransferase [archaeon]
MNIIYNMLIYSVWFFATYYVVILLLLMFLGKNKLFESRAFDFKKKPMVSVLVPAYNEQGKIKHTINSLKKIDYDNIEFIIISDGSKDGTAKEVRANIQGDKRFTFIDRKENRGKAATLNQGIELAKGEFIATMDADSIAEPRIFYKVLPYFHDKKVGAVTVSVLVKNPKGFLHKLFYLEFAIGLSLMLKVFSFVNALFVTPGPFSIYRKSVLDEIGGFDPNCITEDSEIAYRIHKHHYKIDSCMEAKAYTILPPTFRKITIQRKRWYSGAIQTIIKHRNMLFNKKYGAFGYFVAFNYILIFLGITLFLASSYLGLHRTLDSVLYFKYTDINVIERLMDIRFDILAMSRATVLGLLSLVFTMFVLVTGLMLTRTKCSNRKLSIVAWPLMFFLYQFFWLISVAALLTGRKIKWR